MSCNTDWNRRVVKLYCNVKGIMLEIHNIQSFQIQFDTCTTVSTWQAYHPTVRISNWLTTTRSYSNRNSLNQCNMKGSRSKVNQRTVLCFIWYLYKIICINEIFLHTPQSKSWICKYIRTNSIITLIRLQNFFFLCPKLHW